MAREGGLLVGPRRVACCLRFACGWRRLLSLAYRRGFACGWPTGRCPLRWFRSWVLCRKREPIEAALPNHALATDVSLASLRAIRSPRPVTSPKIAVDLDATLEQAILYGLAQTDAGVDDVESELQAAVLFFGARMQADRADRGANCRSTPSALGAAAWRQQ